MRGMFATRATKKTETHTPIRHCTRTLFAHDRKTTRAAHYLTKDGKREQHEQFIYLTSASTEIQTQLEKQTVCFKWRKKKGAAALLSIWDGSPIGSPGQNSVSLDLTWLKKENPSCGLSLSGEVGNFL